MARPRVDRESGRHPHHDAYRLITTLLDPGRYPADALVRLDHEMWEIEPAYLALRHTLLNGRARRSHDRRHSGRHVSRQQSP